MIKISNPIGQFTDEFVELGQDTAKKFVSDVVKGIPRAAKTQITGKPIQDTSNVPQSGDKKADRVVDDKVSPVTGKPVPSQKILTELVQATNQLSLAKLKKTREELAKIRLKVSVPDSAKASAGEAGPELPAEKKKSVDDIVQQTLKNAGSTGEFKAGAG